jgi:hypothetical protein
VVANDTMAEVPVLSQQLRDTRLIQIMNGTTINSDPGTVYARVAELQKYREDRSRSFVNCDGKTLLEVPYLQILEGAANAGSD